MDKIFANNEDLENSTSGEFMKNSRFVELREKLTKPPGIIGREEYAISAILVPIVELNGEEHLLFEKRAPHIRQGSETCFPGGHFDRAKDKSCLETALRETQEELGIRQQDIQLIGQLDTLVSPRGIIVECFLGLLDLASLDDLVLDREEVAEVFSVPVRWFLGNRPEIYHTRIETQSSYKDDEGRLQVLLPVEELGLPGRYKKNRSEWIRKVMVYRYQNQIIWGLTGSVVENLLKTVFAATFDNNWR